MIGCPREADVVWVLTEKDIAGLVPMADYLEAMERAYSEYGQGQAAIRPRQRYQVISEAGNPHVTNIIGGAVPSYGVSAIRLNSWPRRRPGAPAGAVLPKSQGIIVLFDLDSGELLAFLVDHTISDMRVGATTGIAMRRLARTDAASIGVLGSGRQARSNLEAICLVRNIKRANVYSPNRQHREWFATEMSRRLEVEIQPVESSAACIQGVDIVGCFTSSDAPVFDGDLIEPGQTIVSIRNTDHIARADEVDQRTFLKADRIVISDRLTLMDNRQSELLALVDQGAIPEDRVVELSDVVVGRAEGRRSRDEVMYYKNNTGMGIQFAAAGSVVLAAARASGLGTELPAELFNQ
jgi:ornithine cyclodeaminase/alanine dehydrogenase-like protein (mu-crystallin family)